MYLTTFLALGLQPVDDDGGEIGGGREDLLHLSYRVATLRQSIGLPNKISILLRP